ncbi:GNAT family N-acetyltransferase [Caballeronia sp. SEWSISQ10-4 2]|uniref:GNAT family N-acetyltransferase n=1 Tax=Caballeronia sp. SEWSISQ10-4 2 TaxID=2937438 RepID=UPI002650153F|nr:GNAT family N-acetyltransferase [Caballeronia sp. SEWSISQ10-4 2]MDN7183264.1 GNAT family N-acetyltransferase [Caballeronia sp. SEWSISQ10-4 2]
MICADTRSELRYDHAPAGMQAQALAPASFASCAVDAVPLRFSDVCRTLPRAAPLADVLAGPAWADAWARAIVCFWETELAHGALDPAEPAYLFDLEPGRGTLAWLLTSAIEERLLSSTAAALKPRYLACGEDEDDATLSALRVHPRWAPSIAQGRFGTARWHVAEGGALHRHGDANALESTINPVVVLAPGWFSHQPADLYAVHYGAWLEARVEQAMPPDEPGVRLLSYEWDPASPQACASTWALLAAQYLARLVSAPVMLPTGAAVLIDAIQSVSAGRYLLLACDIGTDNEAQIRDGALAAPEVWQGGESMLPVNFHALAWRQRGAWVHQRQVGAHGLVLYAAWSREGAAPSTMAGQRALHRMRDALDACVPDDALHLAQAVEELGENASFPTLLSLLRASHHDPCALSAMLPQWLERASLLSRDARHAWRIALIETWRHHLPAESSAHFESSLAKAAVTLGAWGLAKDIWRTSLALAHDPFVAHLHLAQCLAASGALADALPHLEKAKAQAYASGNESCRTLHDTLIARAARWRGLDWYRPELARDAELALEPLGAEHSEAFLDSYADPQIAVMANLPELKSLADVLMWIEEEANVPGRTSFAVVDAQRGFVGVASLCRAGAAGFFYFWITADAQGQGFGTRAARLLFAQAHANGVSDIFTNSYSSNGRSLFALQRLEFRRLPVQSTNDPGVEFFHRSAVIKTVDCAGELDLVNSINSTALVTRLERLCVAIDAPAVFVNEAVTVNESALAAEPPEHHHE